MGCTTIALHSPYTLALHSVLYFHFHFLPFSFIFTRSSPSSLASSVPHLFIHHPWFPPSFLFRSLQLCASDTCFNPPICFLRPFLHLEFRCSVYGRTRAPDSLVPIRSLAQRQCRHSLGLFLCLQTIPVRKQFSSMSRQSYAPAVLRRQ